MPSPIGHALAGVATAWAADLVPGGRAGRAASPSPSRFEQAGGRLTLACAALAVAPDIDLFFSRIHRTATHSLTAVVVVGLVAGALALRTRTPAVRIALTCAAAYATHVLTDWLGTDRSVPYGIQLLWPFDSTWFIAGRTIFLDIERRQPFTSTVIRGNLNAMAQEVAIFAPILIALAMLRVKLRRR